MSDVCGTCGDPVGGIGVIAEEDGSTHACVSCIERERPKQKRIPVDYRYDAINPTFLKWMARIGAYATEKYDAWEQYTGARLTGEKSPLNHIYEHLRQFSMGERYDHFDGDVRWHLVAVAYNAMMEFYYVSRFGHVRHPLDHVESTE